MKCCNPNAVYDLLESKWIYLSFLRDIGVSEPDHGVGFPRTRRRAQGQMPLFQGRNKLT